MKLLMMGAMSMVFMGCGTLNMDQREYVLKLADKCDEIHITPQQTKLKCPNYVEGRNGTRPSTATKHKG